MTNFDYPVPPDEAFSDPKLARECLEQIRWGAEGPRCPHCGEVGKSVAVGGAKRSHRDGLYYCNACGHQYTVTVGTMLDRSKVPPHKWLLANHLYCVSGGKIPIRDLQRQLGVSYKTAWFMVQKIQEALEA